MRILFGILLILALAGCGRAAGAAAAPAGTDRAIQNKGSDTLVNLALAWAERYRQLHPEVAIAVTGGGSGTGIAALINGTVDIANASRQMKEDEMRHAEQARAAGGAELPSPVKWMMRAAARVMTRTAHHL